MIRKYSKVQWASLMGEEQNKFLFHFQFSLHKKMDHSLLLDEFLKRLQGIKLQDGRKIVTIEMEVENIVRKGEEVVFDFNIDTFFEGECQEDWALETMEAALRTSIVPFNWMKISLVK
ncbi:hypothetical protein PPM_p0191 (plasmid) [Paenibacillus polymyxa M1]|uniref:hypothetical protein n=2 Tax=Paenibacillus polymyxa TaxID=1406 RepID=UPI00021BBBAB|nr:hypothetical protein [Paenibacillus polymyxa]CCC86341.1 hypothetical protein PPM_p0191 [Paenibacillus polymyxa M1]